VSSKRFLTAVAWSTGAVSLAAFAAAWGLAARTGDVFDVSAQWGPDRFMVAYALAGTVLASRRRSNPVGWFLLAIGLVTALRGLAGEYARYAQAGPHNPGHPGAMWAAWYVNWSLTLLFPDGILTFLLLLFPDGRPLTRRWLAVFWGAAGLSVLFLVLTWLNPAAVSVGGLRNVPNPTGLRSLPHVLYSLVGDGTWVFSFVFLILAVVSVVLRYRRSAGEERLQLKWFAYATAVSLGLIFALLPVASMGRTGQVTYDLAIVAGIGLALPVAIGTAVLKYRLYAIDRIISRTVSYALVTGLVAGVYLGCIALLSQVRPVRGSIGVAVSVLVAAALFNPLRRRVQGAVDRRFDRARYDAERVVAGFSERLREQVNLDVLGADLTGVVQHVLAPEHVSLWLRDQPDGQERAGADS
jgi:steroid 5-alpha reductase family enzyme